MTQVSENSNPVQQQQQTDFDTDMSYKFGIIRDGTVQSDEGGTRRL